MRNVKKLIFLSLLTSVGLVLSVTESMMPMPFIAPGAKLGLSNMVVLVTLVLFGFKEALTVGVLKSIILILITGSVTSFFYSLTGAILSCITMALAYSYLGNVFSLIGVSILGAVAHNVGQILTASLMMQNLRVFSDLPILLLTSLFTGYFVGLASIFITKNLKKSFDKIF